ncbi:MAG: type I-U CRISPR-associated protein Cas7 [Oligoflexia bacterium]|nr:type I-U CRISPR-associated protein Cas7 [Oligoflexia bacterium]
MSVDLGLLHTSSRLLFSVPLRPVQGQRFQPTGFPGLGAATFQTRAGVSLLVESAQSMANRLETVCWDEGRNGPVDAVNGVSHVTITRSGKFFTDTMLEAHRLNSPYLLEGANKSFAKQLKADLGELGDGPIDRRRLAEVLLKYDAGSLIHGVFLAKKELAGGRLRVARALSAFIEADGVSTAASGGVKNDHVNPQGDTKKGYGNVPFARDEFTAERITLYINLDLGLLRGYGLPKPAVTLLMLLSLYKVAALLDGELRLRTACDLVRVDDGPVRADKPRGWVLPAVGEIAGDLRGAIDACGDLMCSASHAYEDKLSKGKADKSSDSAIGD